MAASDTVVKVILFFFLGALVVLVVTHASGFATAVTATGGQVANMGALLSGAKTGNVSTGYQLGTGKSAVTFG